MAPLNQVFANQAKKVVDDRTRDNEPDNEFQYHCAKCASGVHSVPLALAIADSETPVIWWDRKRSADYEWAHSCLHEYLCVLFSSRKQNCFVMTAGTCQYCLILEDSNFSLILLKEDLDSAKN